MLEFIPMHLEPEYRAQKYLYEYSTTLSWVSQPYSSRSGGQSSLDEHFPGTLGWDDVVGAGDGPVTGSFVQTEKPSRHLCPAPHV